MSRGGRVIELVDRGKGKGGGGGAPVDDDWTRLLTRNRQGAVEGSNVSASLSAVRLISANRHFEMLRRASSLVGDEMDSRAVRELGRFS